MFTGMGDSLPKGPTPSRRQRKRQRMASHLAATAFALFEQQGYQAVTMEQIADEADVAKATLYNYFPVKEALVAHRFRDEIVAGMADLARELALLTTFESRMRRLLRESAAWHAARRDYMAHYIAYLNSQATRDDATTETGNAARVTYRILSDMFRTAQEAGEIRDTVPAEQMAWSFQFLLFGAITRWLTASGLDLTKEFLAVFDLFLNGVAIAPKDRSRR